MRVPFISNTPDNIHCLPVSFMMIIRAFDPSFATPLSEWAGIVGFEEGKGTWANASLVWLKEHGYDVKHITRFDYHAFSLNPEEYLLHAAGEEVGRWQIKHTNIPAEVERVKKLLEAETIIQKRIPDQGDIRRYLDEGYLLRACVNLSRLNGKDGYIGHAVVITNYSEDGVYIHDPGLPPVENRFVSWDDFEAVWADPNDDAKELDAVRLRA